MKRNLMLLAALTLSVGLVSSCSKKEETPPPADQPTSQDAPAAPGGVPNTATDWSVTFKADKQEGIAEGDIVGLHGLTLYHDGKVQAGPGPQGQVWIAYLTDAELKKISDPLSGIIGAQGISLAGDATKRDTSIEAAGTITFKRGAEEKTLLRLSDKQISFHLSSQDQAEAVASAVLALAKKHYSTPFPNACLDAAQKLENLYAEHGVTSCQTDTDCNFVDTAFDPIQRTVKESFWFDDCTWVRTLGAANGSKLPPEVAQALRDERTKIRNTCGQEIRRKGCTDADEIWYQTDEAEPVCIQNTCRIRLKQPAA